MAGSTFSKSKNKIISGVCGGIARSMGYEAVWVRLAYALITIMTGGVFGLVIYAILAVVMPEEDQTS
jgi:phage shock protein PspC (stress-responsive transcriptional regulator)